MDRIPLLSNFTKHRNPNAGKTYEQIYGEVRGKELREVRRKAHSKQSPLFG